MIYLGQDIIAEILQYLNWPDIANLANVCRAWRSILLSGQLPIVLMRHPSRGLRERPRYPAIIMPNMPGMSFDRILYNIIFGQAISADYALSHHSRDNADLALISAGNMPDPHLALQDGSSLPDIYVCCVNFRAWSLDPARCYSAAFRFGD